MEVEALPGLSTLGVWDLLKNVTASRSVPVKELRSTSDVNSAMDKEASVKERSTAGFNSAMNSEALEECRACLQTIQKQTGYNLFEAWFTPWAVHGAIIADDLSKFADVEISEFDKYSKVICEKCYHRLSDACTFMITVQMSDTTLRQRVDNNLISTTSEVGTSWPQPILLNKSGNGDVDNRIEVEVKQEVLSEDENGVNVDQDWEPTMDIKIEPEEISAPVQSNTQVNGELSTNEMTESNGSSSTLEQDEFFDNTVKEEPVSGDELEAIPDLPLDCMLCFKAFNSVSGLKAHVISQHSYGAVKRKAESSPSPARNKIQIKEYPCNSCKQSFATSTDLMVHRASHSEHVCYVCDRKFNSFYQLMRHGPRCQKKCANAARRDQKRPPHKPKQLSQPVKTTTKAQKLDRKTEEIKIDSESLPISVVSERIQELVKPWPLIDQIDIESSTKQSENEIKSKAEKTVKEKQNFEVKQEPTKIEIETAIEKNHKPVQKPQKVEIEVKVQKQPENGVLEPENRPLEAVTEGPEKNRQVSKNEPSNDKNRVEPTEDTLSEPTTEDILSEPTTEDILSDPSTEDMLSEPTTEDILSEPTRESQTGFLNTDLRTGLSQKSVSSPENIPSNSTPETTTCNYLPNINFDDMSNSKTLLEIIDDNSLHSDSVPSLPNQDDPKEILTNILARDNVEELRIKPRKLTEAIVPKIGQTNALENFSNQNKDNSHVGEEKNPTNRDEITPTLIDEISEMKVHLEINPLNKDTVLFETEMEDMESEKSDCCEPKLASVISEQSDIQHS